MGGKPEALSILVASRGKNSGSTGKSGASTPRASATAFRVLNLGGFSPLSSFTSVTLPMSAALASTSRVNPADFRNLRTRSPTVRLPSAAMCSTVGRYEASQ